MDSFFFFFLASIDGVNYECGTKRAFTPCFSPLQFYEELVLRANIARRGGGSNGGN